MRRGLEGCKIDSRLVGSFLGTLGRYRFTHFTPKSRDRTVSGICSSSLRIVDGVRGSVGHWFERRWIVGGVLFVTLNLLVTMASFKRSSLAASSARVVRKSAIDVRGTRFSNSGLRSTAGTRKSDTCVEGSFTSTVRVCRSLLHGNRSTSMCCGLNGDCCGVGRVTGTVLGCRGTLLLRPNGKSVHTGLRVTHNGAMSGMRIIPRVFFIA